MFCFRMLVSCQSKKGTGLYTSCLEIVQPPTNHPLYKLAPREKYGIYVNKNDICTTGNVQFGGLEGLGRRFRAMKCNELDHLNSAWNENCANLRVGAQEVLSFGLSLSFIHILVYLNKTNMKSQHLIKKMYYLKLPI